MIARLNELHDDLHDDLHDRADGTSGARPDAGVAGSDV
jgi:hypothetical protein